MQNIDIPAGPEQQLESPEALLKEVMEVRAVLGINRQRTQFHSPLWHFWRDPEALDSARKQARARLESFVGQYRSVFRGPTGNQTIEQVLALSDQEIARLAFSTNTQENLRLQEECRQIIQQLWQAGGVHSLRDELNDQSRINTMGWTDVTARYQHTIEVSLFQRLLSSARMRNANERTPDTERVLLDLNQRRLLNHVEQALIDDFLVTVEDYARYLAVNAGTLPPNVRDRTREVQVFQILRSLRNIAPSVTATYRVTFSERTLEAERQRLQGLLKRQAAGDGGLEADIKASQQNIEVWGKHARVLRENLPEPPRDIECREEVANIDVAAFIVRMRSRSPAMAAAISEIPPNASAQQIQSALEQYMQTVRQDRPYITGVRVFQEGNRWVMLRIIPFGRQSSTAALEEIHGELSRRMRNAVNASVPYQVHNINIVGRAVHEVQQLLGANFPIGADRVANVRIGHVMFAELLRAHARHQTQQLFPEQQNGQRTPASMQQVLNAMRISQGIGDVWARYSSYTMALHANYEAMLTGRGHLGPYPELENPQMPGLSEDNIQHYLQRPLPFDIQRALSGGEFSITNNALNQYMFIIRTDYAPRLQALVLMEDALTGLESLMEPVDKFVVGAYSAYQIPDLYMRGLGQIPRVVGGEAINWRDYGVQLPWLPFGLGGYQSIGSDLNRVEQYEQFRAQIQVMRKQFAEARNTLRQSREEIEKVCGSINRLREELRKLMVQNPPESLAWNRPQDRPILEQYRTILQSLEQAQMDLVTIVNSSNAAIGTAVNVNALESNRHENAANLSFWSWIGAIPALYWTLGFPRLRPSSWLRPRSTAFRIFRSVAAPWTIPFYEGGTFGRAIDTLDRRIFGADSESTLPRRASAPPEQFAKRLADIQAAPGANFQEQFQSSFRALTQLEQEAAGNAQMLRQIGARRMALIGEMVRGLALDAQLAPNVQATIRSILGSSQPVTTMQELLQLAHARSCIDRAQIPQLIRALDAAGVPPEIRVRLFDTGAIGGAPTASSSMPSTAPTTRPSWALRGGRWVLGGAGLALSGYAAYQDTREALRINEWRQRLQNEVPGLFQDAGFIQSPTNPNMYVRGEGADQVQVNLTALFAISDEMLARAAGEVAVSGGLLALAVLGLLGSAAANMFLLAGTPMLILMNLSNNDARRSAMRRLLQALPPAILARIPLETLTERTPEDLYSLLSLYVREGTGLLNEQAVRKQNRETMESIDRLAFAVVYRYVQSHLAVNPSLLTEASGDLEQRLWSMRALLTQGFASRAPGSVSFESITQEAGDRALYLLLTSSYARACARWERHLQNPSAADRLLPEEQAELQLRIRALGQTLLPGRAGRTVADEFASTLHPSGDYAAFVQTSPEDLYASFAQTNRLPQLEQNASVIPEPHPNVSQILNGGIDALMSLQGISGVSVSTVFTRVANGRREVLPDASSDAHVQHGVETIQVQTEGGYISYFAFLNGRWMWSSPSYPNWVSVRVNRWQTGVTGRDRLNDIAQVLTSMEENLSTQERSKVLVQAGFSFATLLHDRRPLPQFLQIEPSLAHLSELLTQQLPQGPFGQPPPGSIDSPSSPIAITMMPMNDPPSFTATIGDRTVQYFVQNGLWFWRSATPNAQAYPAGTYPYTVSPGENPSSPQNMHNAIGRVLGRINAGDRSGF